MAQFLKNIMTVSGFTVLSRLTGFLRDMLIAAVLGTGPLADAFFVAFRFPNFFRRLFAEGAFQSAFVPLFASIYKSQGEAAARSVAEQIFAILFVAVTIVMIIVEISAPWLLHGIAPGFTQDTQQLAVAIDFVRVTFPYIGFMSFAAMFAGILNSLDRFASAAAAPILLNIFMIAALLGWNICAETPAHALVWAVVFAGAAQALWLAFTCRKIGFGLRLRRPKLSPEVKAFLKRLGPGALSAAVLQFNALIGMIMASTLPLGTVSHLFFADRLVQLPLSLIGVAISTTLLPRLSRDVQEGAWPQIYYTQEAAIKLSLLLAVPAMVGLYMLAPLILDVLFHRGAFIASDVIATARILEVLALGIPAYVATKILNTIFYAHHDTKTPLYIGAISVAIDVLLMFVLIPEYQGVGIAAATTIAYCANALLLGAMILWRQLWQLNVAFIQWLAKLLLVNGVMIAALHLCHKYMAALAVHNMLVLSTVIASGLISYAGMVVVTRAYKGIEV